VAPGALKVPMAQAPMQLLLVAPALLPKRPPGHSVHAAAPAALEYCPAGHGIPVALIAPAPQYAPGALTHAPLQVKVVCPVVLPNLPIGQREQVTAPGPL
jgi:hypothetical protein